MDNEVRKLLSLIMSQGPLVNGEPTSQTFSPLTDSLERISDNVGQLTDAATSDDLSDITTTSALAKLRRILLRFSSDAFAATIQGASRTDLETMLANLATYFSAAGAAWSVQTNNLTARTNLEQVLEDATTLWGADGTNVFNPTIDGVARTDLDAALAALSTLLITTGITVNNRTTAYTREAGVKQVLEVSVTSAANAGDVTIATVTTQPCVIESVVIHADAAQTGDMTTCAVFGGAGKVVTFISATDATQANLNAADKQVSADLVVRLAATKTMVISLVGTGATAVDLTVTITYRAAVDGGYLA